MDDGVGPECGVQPPPSPVTGPLDAETLVGALTQCIAFQQAAQWEGALACLDALPRAYRDLLPAVAMRAEVLSALARFDEAFATLDDYAMRVPDAAAQGVLARRQALLDAGLRYFERRLLHQPDDLAARFQRGCLHYLANAWAAAAHDFDAVLRVEPDHLGALNNQGNVLVAQGRHAYALGSYERLLALAPGDAQAHFNRGNVLQGVGSTEAAIAAYHAALAIRPDFAEAHMELAHCHLRRGDFATGWRRYEWRWQTSHLRAAWPSCTAPVWQPAQPLHGKTILLWAEQGMGDCLQFLRYVPLVATQAHQVVLRVPAALRPLATTLAAQVEVVCEADPLPGFDLHCPLMSLPHRLGEYGPALPSGRAYLHADPARMAVWRERLGPRRRPRIGLTWAGRQYGRTNPARDIPLAQLARLAEADVDWVSLNKEIPAGDDLACFPSLQHWGDALADFGETAALIATLDAVVSVDSAVAHLTGALGKPGYLLLPQAGEWRWGQDAAVTPWYPSLQLCRQPRHGEWAPLVATVLQALSADSCLCA